jgi:vacuolar-type H+-ATPase subunit E/Vma4
MAGLVREDLLRARDYLPDAPMVVQCVPALADMVREALKEIGAGEATVAVVPDAPFGLVVQSADGRIEVNLTLARRIASERSRLAIHILSLLKAPLP